MASQDAKEAKVTWLGGMKFAGSAGSGHTMLLDVGEEHGGENAGFRPMELLLLGLAGCTAVDVVEILRKKRQPVTGLKVHVRGTRASEHPRVYTDIAVEYIVQGNGVSPKAVEDAIALSEHKYCSAGVMLGTVARITSSYRIEPAGAEQAPA